MTDEYTVCAAAFFRNKGKNVITEKEFVMVVSMDLHWMPYVKAKQLLAALIDKGILVRSGELVKPSFEISDIDVPVAYRPSDSLISSLKEGKAEKPAEKPAPVSNDLLPTLIEEAVKKGIQKRDFVAEANSVSKRLNVDMLAAALIVLRDRGVDIAPYVDAVYEAIAQK